MAKQLALLIDLDRCIGCHTCTIACKVEHADPPGIKRIPVVTMGTGRHDSPSGVYPNVWMYYLPRMCQHCQDPPCAKACSYGAIIRREDGIVRVDEDNCPGCELCVEACPYGVISMDTDRNVAVMCDLCADRIDAGLAPFCVECCPALAIFYGDMNDEDSEMNVHKRTVGKPAYGLVGGNGSNRPVAQYLQSRSFPSDRALAAR
ncbi:MAG: 4Fe-4S dicluster domain-containing protein [Chloroflexi bacterium]|nr:4Fe-4S dicluster domain-containing protein [Chloroflexota bacterium]